ncbi:MAG: efflux RND transporter periplasmic adaptor subunit [Deltaproteobacteria bacterium]|nr:efflux RND transporter periplasmic adaptor subunit [Deltaproteobacteria bacterium]
MAKILKILLVLVMLAATVVGGYAWVRNYQPDDRGFTFVNVARGDITEKAVAVGQIEPRQKFHIKSKISGIVRRCPVDVGDRVKVGDPIIEISPDPTPVELLEAERQVEKALSAYNRAKADWERSKDLVEQGVESINRLDADHEAYGPQPDRAGSRPGSSTAHPGGADCRPREENGDRHSRSGSRNPLRAAG